MKVQIQKWGNSLALRIPKSFAVESNVTQGSSVNISLEDGRMIVTVIEEPEFSLGALLAQVTEDNIHGETETGNIVGKEEW